MVAGCGAWEPRISVNLGFCDTHIRGGPQTLDFPGARDLGLGVLESPGERDFRVVHVWMCAGAGQVPHDHFFWGGGRAWSFSIALVFGPHPARDLLEVVHSGITLGGLRGPLEWGDRTHQPCAKQAPYGLCYWGLRQ